MVLSFSVENCTSQIVFDILETDHMTINEVVNIPNINLNIAYTRGLECKSAFGPSLFEFTIYNVITPVLCGLLANWLFDKFRKHKVTEIKIENVYITINSEKDLENILKRHIDLSDQKKEE